MKTAFACLLLLVASATAGTPCFEVLAGATGRSVSDYGSREMAQGDPTEISQTTFIFRQPEDGRRQAPESGAQIHLAPDAAMNASVVPSMDAILCLIAVLCLSAARAHTLSTHPPRQASLLRVLFRAIIAPNAP